MYISYASTVNVLRRRSACFLVYNITTLKKREGDVFITDWCRDQRWAKLLILVDFDVDIDNILEIDVEFDVWSDFDFGIEYCQANLQMLKLSTNLDMQLLNLEFES